MDARTLTTVNTRVNRCETALIPSVQLLLSFLDPIIDAIWRIISMICRISSMTAIDSNRSFFERQAVVTQAVGEATIDDHRLQVFELQLDSALPTLYADQFEVVFRRLEKKKMRTY